jgi:hypothetical protein
MSSIHKNSPNEGIMNELIEILMEKLEETLKQNIQDELKQFQDTTNEKT